MQIEILQVGTGDSIWVNHNKKNIVIDGGKTTNAIIARYNKMPQEENIDLLVVTHIDSDHISGIIALVDYLKKNGTLHRLKQIWFNFPKIGDSNEFSVPEGNELSTSLCEIGYLNWCNNTSVLVGKIVTIGDIKLHVLAPNYDVAGEYMPSKPDELGVRTSDWHVDLKTLIDNVDEENLDEGGANSQSIVILLECENKQYLFSGDCTPSELFDALHSYNKEQGSLLKLDLMKLPHHGSTRNISKKIFDEIDCSNFIISTNVNNKYLFPNKETIAKLISYRKKADQVINVYFNYSDSHDVLGITNQEQKDYHITLNVCNEFNF